MKNHYILLLAALALCFASCEDNTPFDTQSPDDAPLILIPYESTSGTITMTQSNPETPCADSVVVTPSAYTTVNWYLDGQLVFTGTKLDKCFPSGQYDLVIEAVTQAGKKTSRTGTFIANPYLTDPYSAAPAGGRHMVPGIATSIEGVNLAAVTAFELTSDVEGMNVVQTITPTSATDTRLEFVLPEMADGAYYVFLKDEAGKRYGANVLNVHNSSVVLSGFEVFKPGEEWTISGVKLENVASVTIDETVITELTATATSVTFTAPAAEPGNHTVSMKNADGSDVLFSTAEGLVAQATTFVSAETTIWSGSVTINWEVDPPVTAKVTKEAMANVPAGATISIYFDMAGDTYHQIQVTTDWWSMNLMEKKDVHGGDNPITFTYTAEGKAKVEEEGSMLVVGFGATITSVTYK